MLNPPTPERIETAVHDTIRAVLAERFGEICTFGGTDKLNAKLGLSSLDLAFIVAELEVALGVDPFAKLVSITSIQSVGDLVSAYRKALFPEAETVRQDKDLLTATRRAQARRARRDRK